VIVDPPARRRTVRIGLTGPIGCGKSTIARWLAELGAVVVDADVVARQVVEPGEPALERVFERFGPGVRDPDGSLDRAALGRIVFEDPHALAALESIVHPAVRPRIVAAVADAEAGGAAAVVIEAIKLVEAGYVAECDEVWLVRCDPRVQLERLVARGTAPEDAARRIEAQGADLGARLAGSATRAIDTSGSAEEVRREVEKLYRSAIGSSATPAA
jgi:dephospho-CoA kinase